MRGVLGLSVELWTFGSPGGLQILTFSKCWASPPHLAKVGLRHSESQFSATWLCETLKWVSPRDLGARHLWRASKEARRIAKGWGELEKEFPFVFLGLVLWREVRWKCRTICGRWGESCIGIDRLRGLIFGTHCWAQLLFLDLGWSLLKEAKAKLKRSDEPRRA
jgi:hypothetical protein